MKRAFGKPSVLPRSFYIRSPEVVARELLGKLLVVHRDGERLAGRIVEMEAYLGLADPASHAYGGRTAWNDALFGPPGFTDVYLIYGMHYCLNFSCLPDGDPGGVLVRALVPVEGIATMAKLRKLPVNSPAKALAGGPGKLCQALGITRALHHNLDVTRRDSVIQVIDDGCLPETIEVTPRIGIRKAVDLPLRFLTKDFG